MITKELKDWSIDDLIVAATWKVMDEIIKGQLRDGVHAAILLALKWKAVRDEATNQGGQHE